jgi:hypothetical protein
MHVEHFVYILHMQDASNTVVVTLFEFFVMMHQFALVYEIGQHFFEWYDLGLVLVILSEERLQ